MNSNLFHSSEVEKAQTSPAEQLNKYTPWKWRKCKGKPRPL